MSEEPPKISRQRAWQIKQKELGKCMLCAEPLATKNLCIWHSAAALEKQRARTGAKRRNLGAKTYVLAEKLLAKQE